MNRMTKRSHGWPKRLLGVAVSTFEGWPAAVVNVYAWIVVARVVRFVLLPLPLLLIMGTLVLFQRPGPGELVALGVCYVCAVVVGRLIWPVSYRDAATRSLRRGLLASYWYRPVDVGSSGGEDVEIAALEYAPYGIERLGARVMPSPPTVDALWVVGALTRNAKAALLRTREANPHAAILRIGDAAGDGGIFKGSYALADRDDADLRWLHEARNIPGNPPSPQQILEALTEVQRAPARARPRSQHSS